MRSRILTRRTAGLLGIAGLTVSATVGFAAAGVADTSPSPTADTSDSAAPTTATVALAGPDSVKSSGTATYTVTLTVKNGPLKKAALTPGGSWHDGTVKWTGGCASVDGVTCNLTNVPSGTKKLTLAYSAPKVSKDTSVTMTVSLSGTGANNEQLSSSKGESLLVKKAATSSPTPTKTASPSPTPTKTASPSPTKSSSKPSPTKSHQSHTASHKPSHKPSHNTSDTPSSAPDYNGNVPVPTSVPTGVPSIPAGTQAPFAPPTDTPTLPSVAPSPEGSPRNPNVAEPPAKASGQVHTDAVSVPAAAAAAFVGLGAGTLITRKVRRRGLWRPAGRHRD